MLIYQRVYDGYVLDMDLFSIHGISDVTLVLFLLKLVTKLHHFPHEKTDFSDFKTSQDFAT
jgi:hypothetical protein